jgi:3-phosphoshikimate 1-carboxyvinyltransferase
MPKKVTPAAQLKGTLQLPADKSISHRSAMFAALHEGPSTIQNFSEAADPHSTLQCLRQLGVSIRENGNEIMVNGVGRNGFQDPDEPLDCGNSGTTMRLLTGILGGAEVSCTLTGDESLSVRTMKRIIEPLREMDIEIEARDDDFAPLHIRRNQPVKALHFPLPIASAQLKSCVLLAGLFGADETEVIETQISRDHTERLLQLPVEESNDQKIIRSSLNCAIPTQSYRIPGDFSAAAFWLVAGSIHSHASIELLSTGINPSRTGALHILREMGADVSIKNKRNEGFEPVADLQVSSSTLEPVNITAERVPNCIDELPVLIIAMLRADGMSSIRGAGELRHKETDRLGAMAQVLKKAGASFKEFRDGFDIYGDPGFIPKGTTFASEEDHRIAMSAAVLALMAENHSYIEGANCTRISYPSFWKHLSLLTK